MKKNNMILIQLENVEEDKKLALKRQINGKSIL